MRTTLGPVIAHLAMLAAGFGVLQLAGQLRPLSVGRLVFAAGLAYMAGLATVGTTLIVLNVAGVGLSLGVFGGVCAVLAAGMLAGVSRRSVRAPRVRRPTIGDLHGVRAESWVATAILALLAWIAFTGARALAYAPLSEFDSWLIWTRKAVLLFYNPHLPDLFLQTNVESGGHWDYPLLYSMLQAVQFRSAGGIVPERTHLVSWLILFAFVWAAAYLVRRSTRPVVWAGVLAGMVALEVPQVVTGLADSPMACFLGLGALAVGLWLQSGRTSDLAIGAVMLAGAAGMKTEGIMGAVIVLGVAFVIELAGRHWRRARIVAAAGLAVAITAILPWQLWVATHDVPATTSLRDALSPAYLVDRIDRVWPSVQALYAVMADLDFVRLVLPAAIALAVVRLRSMPRVAVFYLTVGLLYFLSLVWAYWSTPLDLEFLIGTSVTRVHVGVALLSTAAILQLAGGPTAVEEPPAVVAEDAREPQPLPPVAQPAA
jgi:hypothetical protein